MFIRWDAFEASRTSSMQALAKRCVWKCVQREVVLQVRICQFAEFKTPLFREGKANFTGTMLL